MPLVIHPAIRQKLADKSPPVTRTEILEGFANRIGRYLYDDREDNRTEPRTKWFVAETNFGRKLKICFIQKNDDVIIKTAYTANKEENRIYRKVTRQID